MNQPAAPFLAGAPIDTPQEALTAAAALPLVLATYPLFESLRTCRLQTSVAQATGYGRAPVNVLSASTHQWTHKDRDVVTPANDLLYFCAWVNLADGPVTLHVPALPDASRYYVVELLDAWTNNFENLGPRNVRAAGADIVLAGPGQHAAGDHVVRCPTSLVWLLGRVLVTGADDLPAASAFENGFRLSGGTRMQPACVRDWQEGGEPALDFFANIFNALREYPAEPSAAGLLSLLRKCGIRAGDAVDVGALRPAVQQGLVRAWHEGMALIEANTRSHARKSWTYSLLLGRYGDDWMQRAVTAMKGLGALRADEAVYAAADYDADGELLHGRHAYALHFPAGHLPPAQAFWSVSLYGADRFFTDNAIGRYALGDHSPGLQYDADGGLTLTISHQRPTQAQDNWLPAPDGPFYLILRLYHPTDGFMAGGYVIPPLRRIA
ncbi:hypothetical protein CF68_10125 [Cupriavidus sp. SK-4]|uniref:DUF1254 domain-containing protein n=1 Tax=Cupriavidus sp. SK-4 TaxID=574750 RepID=UPI0004468D2C|nr:DUF1254 domain-containing protein [Cupriavidus sp. SK-4]EYS85678.1 hypothetical protein CF68_10125 [Cupriavidus sp. SK-4]